MHVLHGVLNQALAGLGTAHRKKIFFAGTHEFKCTQLSANNGAQLVFVCAVSSIRAKTIHTGGNEIDHADEDEYAAAKDMSSSNVCDGPTWPHPRYTLKASPWNLNSN